MFFSVLKKEAKQLLSDKGVLAIALIQPIIFIVVFGSAFQGGDGDLINLRTVVVDHDNTLYSSYVIDAVHRSDGFNIVEVSNSSLDKHIEKLNSSEIRAVVYIPKGFGDKINRSISGNLSFYLDSSDFMVYKSLQGYQGDVIGYTLENISNNILTSLEEERDTSKTKVDEIKELFEDIKAESEDLDNEIDNFPESSDLGDLEDFIDDLKTGMDDQIENINNTQNALNFLISQLQSLSTSETAKKDQIIAGLSQISQGFEVTKNEIKDNLEEIDSLNSSLDFSSGDFDDLQDRLNRMRDLFEEAEALSDSVNFDFDKLEKDFLSQPINLNEKSLYGDITYFDYLAAGVLSLVVFFIGLMAPATNIIYEKEKNTLYRVSTTPVAGISIFLGKFILFVIFGFIEMLYTITLAIAIYGLRIDGSIYAVILILFLLNCSAISLGLLISSKVKTMQQGLIIVPVIVIPLFLISNAFFPKDMFPEFMNYFSLISPMTFANNALRIIMIKGFALTEVMRDIYALIGFTVVPLILFVWNYRRIKY